jgi:hypothetical protein
VLSVDEETAVFAAVFGLEPELLLELLPDDELLNEILSVLIEPALPSRLPLEESMLPVFARELIGELSRLEEGLPVLVSELIVPPTGLDVEELVTRVPPVPEVFACEDKIVVLTLGVVEVVLCTKVFPADEGEFVLDITVVGLDGDTLVELGTCPEAELLMLTIVDVGVLELKTVLLPALLDCWLAGPEEEAEVAIDVPVSLELATGDDGDIVEVPRIPDTVVKVMMAELAVGVVRVFMETVGLDMVLNAEVVPMLLA